LAVADKILTWKILQQRGWLGPGMCHLCKNSSEDNAHLFIHCNFTKQTWIKISSIKKIRDKWEGTNLDVCLTNWLDNKSNSASLETLFVWHIWLEKNAVLFEGKEPSVQSVAINVLGEIQKPEERLCTITKQRINPEFPIVYLVAFFDGVA
jgi:hypothetical protein